MFYIKHSALNILRNIRYFIPLVIVLSITLLMVLYTVGMRRNITAAYDESFRPVVAIIRRSGWQDCFYHLTLETANRFTLSEYVIDYYVLTDNLVRSINTSPVPQFYCPHTGLPFITRVGVPFLLQFEFRLGAYSDVSLSLDFVEGRRYIAEGRFPETANEIMVSQELAKTNNYTIGSIITVYMRFPFISPTRLDLEIVGFFETNEAYAVGTPLGTELAASEFAFIRNYICDDFTTVAGGMGGIDRRNDLLTVLDTINTEDLLYHYTATFHSTVALYYLHSIDAIHAFMQEVGEILPPSLVMLDNLVVMEYVQVLVDKMHNAILWLAGIVGAICIILNGLIIHYNFKARAYEIGVLRSRGLSRKCSALLFTSEILVAALVAFLVAGVFYNISFVPFVSVIQNHQGNDMLLGVLTENRFSIQISNAIRHHDFAVSFSVLEFAGGMLAAAAFAMIIGLISVVYIVRNEPIKTMTKS